MPHTLKIAAVQMDAARSPVTVRLGRAARLIEAAAQQGAKLIVLPQQFHTGYDYDDDQYTLAEPAHDSPTLEWLARQAAQYEVYLATALPLRVIDEVQMMAVLISPDGQRWTYAQQTPHLWERAFVRDSQQPGIFHTPLGRIGLLIGWDAAHADIWQRYAARVDLMLVIHSTPDWWHAHLKLDGDQIHLNDLTIGQQLAGHSAYLSYLPSIAAWLRVPIIAAGGSGQFDSLLPLPRLSLTALLAGHPHSAKWTTNAHAVRIQAPFTRVTGIFSGTDTAHVQVTEDGDETVLSEITRADKRPRPQSAVTPLPAAPLHTDLTDAATAAAMTLSYTRGVRRQWGARMAPLSRSTRLWRMGLIAAALVGILSGILIRQRR